MVENGVFTQARAAANGGGPSQLQSVRLVAAVAELDSLGRKIPNGNAQRSSIVGDCRA